METGLKEASGAKIMTLIAAWSVFPTTQKNLWSGV